MHALTEATPYELLEALPEGVAGEILAGRLHTLPRPGGPHARATVRLDRTVGRGYDDGEGGPGGWWILIEPEVHLIRDTEVCVPDLAGWRRERMPALPEGHRFEVVPDWVCEVLSPSTAAKDREVKMPLYARFGVAHVWLVDPRRRRFEAYVLDQGRFRCVAVAGGGETVAVTPFEAVALKLDRLWS